MYPIKHCETSCSSPAITTVTCNLLPCKDDIVSVAVSMTPRTWSKRGTLFPDSYCSHSHREANTGREHWGLNVLTAKALEGTLSGKVCACQEPLALSPLLEWGASLKHNTITPVSFSNLWKLIAFREIRAETTRISSSKSKASLSTADRQCLGMNNLRVFFCWKWIVFYKGQFHVSEPSLLDLTKITT